MSAVRYVDADKLTTQELALVMKDLYMEVPRRGRMSETVYRSMLVRRINRVEIRSGLSHDQTRSIIGNKRFNEGRRRGELAKLMITHALE